MAESDQDIKNIVVEHILQTGTHALARGPALVLHQHLQHLVEVEGELGLLYGLTLELTDWSGGVVVQEHVPVMFEVLHWRNIRSHDLAQQIQHG